MARMCERVGPGHEKAAPNHVEERGVIHVLTVHFNTPELTSALVRDLPRSSPAGRAVTVHVLDNCSTKDNLEALRDGLYGLPAVTLDVSSVNVGFGEGINVLASRKDIEASHVLWMLNPDTRLDPDCIGGLEDELDAGTFAIVSPLIYSGDGPDAWIWYCGGEVGLRDLRVQHALYGRRLDEAPHEPFETEFVTGAAPMMRANTFHGIGGFPQGYFLYWEDTYLSWKARQMGLHLGVVPSAHLWHAVGASSGYGQSQTYYYWSTRNRFTLANDMALGRLQLVCGRGGLETLRPVAKAMREREGRLSKTRAALRGTVDGIRSLV